MPWQLMLFLWSGPQIFSLSHLASRKAWILPPRVSVMRICRDALLLLQVCESDRLLLLLRSPSSCVRFAQPQLPAGAPRSEWRR